MTEPQPERVAVKRPGRDAAWYAKNLPVATLSNSLKPPCRTAPGR
jgi:hypothetical protein